MSRGTLCRGFSVACGGRYKLKPISQLVVEALWVNLSSFPPKLAIVAFVVTDMIWNKNLSEVRGTEHLCSLWTFRYLRC